MTSDGFRDGFHVSVIRTQPFEELVGCRCTMDVLGPAVQKQKRKFVAPRHPKRIKGEQLQFKVRNITVPDRTV